MIMDLGLCDSFDQEDIDELQAELAQLDGPSLKSFAMLQEEQPITSFTSIDIIKQVLNGQGKDVKMVGNDEQAMFKAFFYVLLLIGVEERRNYPHLNTLIRQQFYKPNIFQQQHTSSDESRAMLDKCLQYFQEVSEGVRTEEYILREPLFEQACLIMLKNSIEEAEGEEESGVFEQLCRKFNIDMTAIKTEKQGECFQLGVNKNYHIIRENDYYFLAVAEAKQDLNLSKMEMESIKSGESGMHLVAPEASDQSTPKFKNSEVKFRKKSHKNSFGGDMEIVQYRDLLHMQTQKLSNNNANKVLSEYFDVNEVQSCAENMEDKVLKKHSFQDIIDSQIEMKGSTTLAPTQPSHLQRRNRKISSSEIIQYRDFNHHHHHRKEENSSKLHEPLEEEEEEDHMKPPSYNSLVVVKEEQNPPIAARMRTSLIQQKELQRIQERQSSQRESTHPDQQSQVSEEKNLELPDNQSQVKMKDRKYSYFTQQMASTKAKKSKEIESSNYVFRIPKNVHKNSEVISPNGEEHQIIRKRFQENPLRFSQLNAPSESSMQESYQQQRKPQVHRSTRLSSCVYSYQIKFQPGNWYKKEIIYHLDNGCKEVQVFERSFNRPHSQPFIPLRDDKARIRESFDSQHTLPSNLRKDSIHISSVRQQSQTNNSINPYELNETSFLKNRIQSMAQLDPFEPDREDSKSVVFSTCRSMKNITSPPKISFNYLPPNKNTLQSSKKPTLIIAAPAQPTTLQFRQPPLKQSLSPQPTRPQTFSGLLSGPGPSSELRFMRR